ncbi:hypothetical protein [uncultured Lamprocystis sp.]|uniref:hypothetical protein n=1 Tax=uncultured Lamprocystis sp. TaxID=543132 RepID=UPI0025D6EDAB|nr:hypothetical protein [uncultured Lamprocystis sp.]
MNIRPSASRLVMLIAIIASVAVLTIFPEAKAVLSGQDYGYYDDYSDCCTYLPNRGGWRSTINQ